MQVSIAAAAQNAFGMAVLADETAHRPGKNVFLSPTSLFLALAMLENGAAGETLAAMRLAMAVPAEMSDAALQESASGLSKELRSREGIDLSIANALWADPGFPLDPVFVRKCRDLYDADAFSFSFVKPEAADIINSWVKRNTRDRIPDIVDPDTVRNSSTILTNAIYFRGTWRNPFEKADTEDGVFHLVDGRQKKVRMMSQRGLGGAYRAGDGFEAAELPYGRSGMVLQAILPSPGTSPERALSRVSMGELTGSPEPVLLDLRLPRFTLDYSTRLKDALSRMGMAVAFRYPGAEFGPLGSPDFFIGQVLHKTRLEIDEQGTVAAAATAIIGMLGCAAPRPMERRVLVFDRPFGLLLCDTASCAILFAGVVYEPM
jgi:serine protease inhibitor